MKRSQNPVPYWAAAPGEERGVPDVHSGAAENLLAYDDGECNRDCEHPQGDVYGHDEGDEEAADEVALGHFLAPDLAGGELYGQTYDVGH